VELHLHFPIRLQGVVLFQHRVNFTFNFNFFLTLFVQALLFYKPIYLMNLINILITVFVALINLLLMYAYCFYVAQAH
jgi:hypothetical protein